MVVAPQTYTLFSGLSTGQVESRSVDHATIGCPPHTSAPMAGAPKSYPEPVREYVLIQVCDQDKPLRPIVQALNEGEIEPFGVVPVGYSTAQRWVDQEKRLRARAVPLDDDALDDVMGRLWAVAGVEIRKLERDSRGKKPLDIKRLNEIEAFVARCRRHLKSKREGDAPQPPVAQAPEDEPAGLLASLTEPQDQTAATDPPTTSRTAETATPDLPAAKKAPKLETVESCPVPTSARSGQPEVAPSI